VLRRLVDTGLRQSFMWSL